MKQFEIKISNSEVNYEEAAMYMETRVDDIINNNIYELSTRRLLNATSLIANC